jgi:hypothetical protein
MIMIAEIVIAIYKQEYQFMIRKTLTSIWIGGERNARKALDPLRSSSRIRRGYSTHFSDPVEAVVHGMSPKWYVELCLR